MKKAFLAMAAVAMALTSCNNELNEVVEEAQPIKLNINFEKANDGDTRAVKAEFKVSDKVVLMGSNDAALYDIMVFEKTAEGWKLDESHLEEGKNSNINSVNDLKSLSSWKWVAIWSENMTIPSAKTSGVWSLWAGTENYKGETIISAAQTLTVTDDNAITTTFTLKQPEDFVKITLTDLPAGYKLGIWGTQSYYGSIINKAGTVMWGSATAYSESGSSSATPGYASDGGAAFFLQKRESYNGSSASARTFYVYSSDGNHTWEKTFSKALTDVADSESGKTYFGNAIKTAGPDTSNLTVGNTDSNKWTCTK